MELLLENYQAMLDKMSGTPLHRTTEYARIKKLKDELNRLNPLNHNINYIAIRDDPVMWSQVPARAKKKYLEFALIQEQSLEGTLLKETKKNLKKN